MRSLPNVQLIKRHTSPATLRRERARASVRRMLSHMPHTQRRLVEMVILNRASHRTAAAELRLSPGAVTRRVARLRDRLACPIRRALAVHLDTLPEPTRGLAIDHFFGGVTRRSLCRLRDLSDREVSSQLDYVRGWLRALNRRELAKRRASQERLAAGEAASEPIDPA